MIEYILTVLILVVVSVASLLYIKPKKSLQSYKQLIESKGFKVKLYDFQFLGCPPITEFNKATKQHGDAMYCMKHDLVGYDVMLFNTLHIPTIGFMNPELMKGMMASENVSIHYKMPFMIQNIQRSLGKGIAFSEGQEWKRKRKIMNSVFNFDFLMEIIPKIVRICEESFKLAEEECAKNGKCEQKDGKNVYTMKIFQMVAGTFSNVMLEGFFGCESTHQKINNQSIALFITSLNAEITEQTFQLPILIFGPKFAELNLRAKDRDINNRIKSLRNFGERLIQKRLAQLKESGPRQKYQDIIEALVLKKMIAQQNSTTKISTENYDWKQLIEEFCTFFSAGTDTTSHFTQMMIYYVTANEHVEKRLRSQINQIIHSDEDITKQNLKKLVYIDWLQNQTTRYYGPGNGIFTREAKEDHFICGIPIKKGTGLAIQPTIAHYDPKYYKDPLEFRPERWESQCSSNPPYSFVGFSGGPRSCIGKHLALLESKIAIVKFVKRYSKFTIPKKDFILTSKFLIEPEPMEMTLYSS